MASPQLPLFDAPAPLPAGLPDGLRYERGFLSGDEERKLVESIRALPLEEAKYKSYVARRRVASASGVPGVSRAAAGPTRKSCTA